ncbi:MAG: hypothetical protein Q4P23_13325 [Micrococcaceae bacterium]|nr:hypothetical protein [Micrococcaceae bacterium]
MASSGSDIEAGEQPWLVASLALIFDEPAAAPAHQRVSSMLAARRSISLLAEPVSWGHYCVIEMVLAVNASGFIVMADEAGEISFGQQIEGFAIALKRGTGARYAEFDDVDAETGEPIADELLVHPAGGRSVLLGSFTGSEVASFASASKTSWRHFSTGHDDVAVHDGYMPEIMLPKSAFPALMLCKLGPRYAAVFWFAGQDRKLHGYPGFGHGFSVPVRPVLGAAGGSEAAVVEEFLTREWQAPDTGAIAGLSDYGLDPAKITELEAVLAGPGSPEKLGALLGLLDRDPALAGYLDQGSEPESAKTIEPTGTGGTVATGWRKLFNPLAWRPSAQICWGGFEALVALAFFTATAWQQAWVPHWAVVLIGILWGIDALSNLSAGIWRLVRRRRGARI